MVEFDLKSGSYRTNRLSSEGPLALVADGTRWRFVNRPSVWRPPTDVYETDEAVTIRVEVAGMREEDFSISLEDRFLLIRGIRLDVPERRAYHQLEILFGEFNIEVEIPCSVIVDGIDATYQNGFLRIFMPKARPCQVRVGS